MKTYLRHYSHVFKYMLQILIQVDIVTDTHDVGGIFTDNFKP